VSVMVSSKCLAMWKCAITRPTRKQLVAGFLCEGVCLQGAPMLGLADQC
jgi:hypothetical protein